MGRNAICFAVVFAIIGFICGLYVFSWGTTPSIPLPLVLILCPPAILATLSPTSEADTDFVWLITALNTIVYGGIGILLANWLHLDDDSA